MLCNSCIHKNVCKHTDHFKEYEKQYEEMRKKSSLFDKPIECPCYKEVDKARFTTKDIKGLEIVNDFIKIFSKGNKILTSREINSFMISSEILEEHINRLKIN